MRSFGWFTCWGNRLEPGETVTVQVQPTALVAEAGSSTPESPATPDVETPGDAGSAETGGGQVVVALDPSGIEAADFVLRESADSRGRLRIRGDVAAGEEVYADDPAVTCMTSGLGSFLCIGRDLDALQQVTLRKR